MPRFRTTMPMGELRDRNTVSRLARAVEKRREQEGTDQSSQTPPKRPGS